MPSTHPLLHHPLPGDLTLALSVTYRWTPEHAEAVVAEYRRFLALAATGEAAPSQDIDRARSLHRALDPQGFAQLGHPGILEVGLTPPQRYTGTLDRYRQAFAQPAPRSVWPDPRHRPLPRLAAAGTRLAVSAAQLGVALHAAPPTPWGVAAGLAALIGTRLRERAGPGKPRPGPV